MLSREALGRGTRGMHSREARSGTPSQSVGLSRIQDPSFIKREREFRHVGEGSFDIQDPSLDMRALTAAGEGNTAAMRHAAAGRCSIGVASKERVSSSGSGATLLPPTPPPPPPPPPPTAWRLAPPPSAPALRHPQSGYAACGETACLGGECPFLIWLGVSCLGVDCMPSEAAPQKHPAKDGGPMAGVGAGECPCLIWLGTSGIIWWGTTGIGWLGTTGIGWLGTTGIGWLGTTGIGWLAAGSAVSPFLIWLGAGSAAHAAVQMAARVRASTLLRRLMRLATFQIREDH